VTRYRGSVNPSLFLLDNKFFRSLLIFQFRTVEIIQDCRIIGKETFIAGGFPHAHRASLCDIPAKTRGISGTKRKMKKNGRPVIQNNALIITDPSSRIMLIVQDFIITRTYAVKIRKERINYDNPPR
jgi:hypothetical protein